MWANTQTKYGGWWRRKAAFIIDITIFILIAFSLESLLNLSSVQTTILYHLIPTALIISFIASKFQATPGLFAMNLKVKTADNAPLSLSQSIIRYIVLLVPIMPSIFVQYTPKYQNFKEQYFHIAEASDEYQELAAIPNLYELGDIFIASSILMLAWVAPIIFTKEKTGTHDIICKTRVLKNTPNKKENK